MAIEIRETIVTPHNGKDIVQLRISDALRDDESAEILLQLNVQIQPSSDLQLKAVQREALLVASQVLRDLIKALA